MQVEITAGFLGHRTGKACEVVGRRPCPKAGCKGRVLQCRLAIHIAATVKNAGGCSYNNDDMCTADCWIEALAKKASYSWCSHPLEVITTVLKTFGGLQRLWTNCGYRVMSLTH